MFLKRYPKIYTGIPHLDRIQDGIVQTTNQVVDLPILNGVSVSATVGTSDTAINHQLGRVPQGWIITDAESNATVWRTSEFTSTTLTLQASSSVDITMWVF